MINNPIKVGDFIATYDDLTNSYSDIKYDGPTGPGSVATINQTLGDECFGVIEGLDIEKVVVCNIVCNLKNMPTLREIETTGCSGYNLSNLPALQSITVADSAKEPLVLKDEFSHVKRIYLKDIQAPIGYEQLRFEGGVAGDGIHAIFGDEVTSVRIIEGGHVTLGRGVQNILQLKPARMGIDCGSAVPEYELPTRIDFLSPLPPAVGKLTRDGVFYCELHVPAGALETYASHKQWKFAAIIIDADGNTIDNYAERHRKRLEELERQRVLEQAKETEQAKTEKIATMGKMMHPLQLSTRLAKWHPEVLPDQYDFNFYVTVNQIRYRFSMPYNSPLGVWDAIVARLELLESIR